MGMLEPGFDIVFQKSMHFPKGDAETRLKGVTLQCFRSESAAEI